MSTLMLIARTDSESAKLISSTVDVADHPYILGTSGASKSLAEVLAEAEARGQSGKQIDLLEGDWMGKNPLVTFNQGTSSADSSDHSRGCDRISNSRAADHREIWTV